MKNVMGEVTQTGNIDLSGATAMTIDSGAIGKLMGMFSNQYSNKDLAVLREYFCNGDDARIAAGSDRPTEVLLPTALQPLLVVRDYGVGLSKQGLVSTFSTYGLSTKGDSNDETGAFGIGSKAAFTMGQQFTVTGFKDGVKTVVLFFLDPHGVGQRDVRFEGPTDEPNGVEVTVAVPDVDSMREAAESFFATVPKGRALVDGKAPTHLFDQFETTVLTSEARMVSDGEGKIRVQMGPVVYPVNSNILRKVIKRLDGLGSQETAEAILNWNSDDTLLFEVGMGDLTLAPSREDLRDTDATVGRIAAAVQGVSDYVVGGIQARLDAAPTRFAAAMILHREIESLKAFRVSKKSFSWNGVEGFKNDIEVPFPVFRLVKKSWRASTMIVGREDKHSVDFRRADRTLVVAGVAKEETSKVSRYAKRFLESREDVEFILVTETTSGSCDWFEWGTDSGALTMSLSDYRAALREMRDASPRLRTEPAYTVSWLSAASRDLDDRDLLTDIISEGKDLILFHEHGNVRDAFARSVLEKKFTPVVLLAQQSENALRKRVEEDGSVKIFDGSWDELVKKAAARKIKKAMLTPKERFALGAQKWLSSTQSNRFRATLTWVHDLLDVIPEDRRAEITHPFVREVLDVTEIAQEVAKDITDDRRAELEALSRWASSVDQDALPFEFDVKSLAEVFPLLAEANIGTYETRRKPHLVDEMIAYINSKA